MAVVPHVARAHLAVVIADTTEAEVQQAEPVVVQEEEAGGDRLLLLAVETHLPLPVEPALAEEATLREEAERGRRREESLRDGACLLRDEVAPLPEEEVTADEAEVLVGEEAVQDEERVPDAEHLQQEERTAARRVDVVASLVPRPKAARGQKARKRVRLRPRKRVEAEAAARAAAAVGRGRLDPGQRASEMGGMQ